MPTVWVILRAKATPVPAWEFGNGSRADEADDRAVLRVSRHAPQAAGES
jgi:hypothetical protein